MKKPRKKFNVKLWSKNGRKPKEEKYEEITDIFRNVSISDILFGQRNKVLTKKFGNHNCVYDRM